MSLRRALIAFVISAVGAGLGLWLVMATTAGWGTFRGICATIVGTTLLLMIMMVRAGRAEASSASVDDVERL